MALNVNTASLASDASEEARLLREYVTRAVHTALESAESDPDGQPNNDPPGALIYLGNPQTAIPDRLLLSTDLDSDQKILWCLLRMQVQQPSHPAITPKQADLARQLGMNRATVNMKLTVLRIHRWMTRCAMVKSDQTGKYHGLVEAIHDAPLNLADTLYLDQDYIFWLESLTEKQSNNYKYIRLTARKMLHQVDEEASQQQNTDGDFFLYAGPCRDSRHGLEVEDNRVGIPDTVQKAAKTHVGIPDMDKNVENNPCRESRHGSKPPNHRVGNPDMDKFTEKSSFEHTIGDKNKLLRSSSSNNKTTTTTNIGDKQLGQKDEQPNIEVQFQQARESHLEFPRCLTQPERLLAEQRILRNLSTADQQYLLDYLRDRVADQSQHPVENRLGYLAKLAKSHQDGSLEPASYGLKRSASNASDTSAPEPTAEENLEAWKRQMRRMMGDEAAEKHFAKHLSGADK